MDESYETENKQSDVGCGKGEIDTSAPFESVKEAVTRFGGVGFWKPHYNHSQTGIEEEYDAAKAEEEAVQLANDLIMKGRETLEVLKELEATKTHVEELKVKLQKKSAKVNLEHNNQLQEPREGNDKNTLQPQPADDSLMCPSSAPGFILMELKQAKLNLTRTTTDLADIRATIETYNKKIEKERLQLEKTRQRLSSNSSNISSFKEEVDLPRELHRLTSETEQFKKVGEVAKAEVLRAMNEITQTKRKIKTAQIRLIAARKLKEAARASEALARAEIKSLSKSQTLLEGEGVTLSFEEYSSLKLKAQEAEEGSFREVNETLLQVNNAELSKSEMLSKVEEATEEVRNSKRVLEEALSKVEAAKNDKLKAEEALRKWRSDHGQRRKSTVQNSSKFKNSACRTKTPLLDVNGAHLLQVNETLLQVNNAELSKSEMLSKVEEATEEVRNSKRVLEEALSKVEAAKNDKLKAEEALRKWRSDHGQRRKSTVQNSSKFKNSACRTKTPLLDVNGAHLGSDLSGPVLRPMLSIGQILSRKLLLTEEYSEKSSMKRNVSLAQMLSKPSNDGGSSASGGDDGVKRRSAKRKKFGFGRISFLVAKPSKKKKKHSVNSRLSGTTD